MESLNRSFEPMDIDMSSSATENMDMSFDFTDGDWGNTSIEFENKSHSLKMIPLQEENDKKRLNTIKKFHIKVQRDIKNHKNKISKIIAIIILVGMSLIIAYSLNVTCAEEMNIDQLKTDLLLKIYGQSRAIESIIEALKIKESKLLIFFGGTGIGKTYVASLIMDKFGYFSNLYHYTMPSFSNEFSVDFLLGLTMCRNSMFIIDDVSKSNNEIDSSIKQLVNKSKSLNKNVTIVLIYNCMNTIEGFLKECDHSFQKEILRKFKDIDIIKKIIKFEKLSEEHLLKCIENEIGHEGIRTHDLGNLYKNFNVEIDGCKGVYAKMKLFKFIT